MSSTKDGLIDLVLELHKEVKYLKSLITTRDNTIQQYVTENQKLVKLVDTQRSPQYPAD